MNAAAVASEARTAAVDLCRSYSTLFFLDSPRTGLLLLAGTFLYPNIALSGLICLVVAYAMTRLTGTKVQALRDKVILYNALLVGLFIGYLFRVDTTVILLLAAAAGFTMLLTLFLENFLAGHGLPLLSLPFTIIAALLALAGSRFSNLLDATVYFREHTLPFLAYVPEPLPTFFRSTGAVLCIPDVLFGALVWGTILVRSPLIGMALIAGFMIGYAAESLLQLNGADRSASHYFNYSLTFAAIAAVFLVPSRASLWLGGFGAVAASLLAFGSHAFWTPFHIPITALPFNLTLLLLMRSVYSVQPLRAAAFYAGDPEETIERSRLYVLRARGGEPGVFCPFEGQWQVQQAFDGPWTHKGNWRHALDFVVLGPDGKTFVNQGFEPEDYHAFGRPILAPVEGYVVGLCGNVEDNPINRVENHQNWGNYVIIRSVFGYHVVLAHLRKGSVSVAYGEYVTVKTRLGECGNSGYSQEPHLHLQVQYSPAIGAYTTPFHLVNYLAGDELNFHDVPAAGTVIEPIALNLAIERLLTFRLGESYRFDCNSRGRQSDVTVTVGLDELLGTLYLSDGRSRLYFGRVGAQFYFHGFEGRAPSFLAHLMTAAPRLPIIYRNHASFVDHLPLRVTERTVARWVRLWLGMFSRRLWMKPATYRFDPDALELRGQATVHGRPLETFLRFDPVYGFQEVRVGDTHYVRKAA